MVLKLSFVPLVFCACSLIIPVLLLDPLLGLYPLDENYFVSGGVMKCKDGSKTFSRDRVNDNFCDCVDGTDEPGTSACPMGKFYCKNVGSTPRFLFSSRVNDQICGSEIRHICKLVATILPPYILEHRSYLSDVDCCDGSDEYDGNINCPNTCMGGNVVYKMGSYNSKVSNLGISIEDKENKKSKVTFEDMIRKLKGLKMVLSLQVVMVIFLVLLRLYQRRLRSKRRRNNR